MSHQNMFLSSHHKIGLRKVLGWRKKINKRRDKYSENIGTKRGRLHAEKKSKNVHDKLIKRKNKMNFKRTLFGINHS